MSSSKVFPLLAYWIGGWQHQTSRLKAFGICKQPRIGQFWGKRSSWAGIILATVGFCLYTKNTEKLWRALNRGKVEEGWHNPSYYEKHPSSFAMQNDWREAKMERDHVSGLHFPLEAPNELSLLPWLLVALRVSGLVVWIDNPDLRLRKKHRCP